jgi:hypothetical protein
MGGTGAEKMLHSRKGDRVSRFLSKIFGTQRSYDDAHAMYVVFTLTDRETPQLPADAEAVAHFKRELSKGMLSMSTQIMEANSELSQFIASPVRVEPGNEGGTSFYFRFQPDHCRAPTPELRSRILRHVKQFLKGMEKAMEHTPDYELSAVSFFVNEKERDAGPGQER